MNIRNEKAETPAAKAAMEKIRGFIDKYIALSKELLK